jgi:signal transduction histidine kinase
MSSRWYKSLYWRAAIGFVLSLAAILVLQAMLFVLVVSKTGPVLSGQPPDRFARTLARDIGEALDRDPKLDVVEFVLSQFGRSAHPYFVLMTDGRTVDHAGPFSEQLHTSARARLQREPDFDRAERPPPPWGRRGDPGAFGPPRSARFPRSWVIPIVAHGQRQGVVAVLLDAPFSFILSQFAPTLSMVAIASLVAGATLAALLIFGPTRRRLRAVEDAARRLGGGDLSARAPERGGDEVAAVATAFNTMADDLSARAAALASSDRVRRQLLADVSHELTTPLTALRGYLETLRMAELNLDEATRERYLAIMSDETGRLERIIGDLLELARLEGGGGSITFHEVPVVELFERVLARHERASQAAGVQMTTSIAPGAEVVMGDQDRLEQVLQNLAANALRYSPAGSTIALEARPSANGIVMTVSDGGSGIPPEHLPHIFDRFYKVEGSRTVQATDAWTNGSGLGLSIVKAIVERHGGRISVASEPGRTVFTLEFVNPPASARAPAVP